MDGIEALLTRPEQAGGARPTQEDQAMQQAYVVMGSLSGGRVVELDEALPVGHGKVRVIVEVLAPPAPPTPHDEFMAQLRERQRQRGHVPRTREEVDAYLKAERESWDD
jgi:hypothetical protein